MKIIEQKELELKMTKGLKRKIGWHFKNYEAVKAMGAESVTEIAEAGLTIWYGEIVRRDGFSDPTPEAAARLSERAKSYFWAKAVENTIATFKHRYEYNIVKSTLIDGKPHGQVIRELGIPRSSYFYWLDLIFVTAGQWVLEYGLAR
jgi:hypothetical protein